MVDLNYTHSFNNPIDNTVVGSTALARNNEVQLAAMHVGGDFTFDPSWRPDLVKSENRIIVAQLLRL